MKRAVLFSILGVAAALPACAGQPLKPAMVSSADTTSYAAAYPEELERTRARLAEEKTRAQSLSAGLAAEASGLKPPIDSELILEIVDAANEAGQSEAFAAAADQERAVRRFWDEERGPIGNRISGAVQQKAVEAKCEGSDLTGAVPHALREGVDRQLERRLREQNEAHLLIERHKGRIGPANTPALQKLVDDVTLNSYLVYVALIVDANRIAHMLSERRAVERTLEDAIEQETRPASTPASPAERKASAERLSALTKSRDLLHAAVDNAEGETRTSEDQVKAAQSEYQSALSALRDEIRKLSLARPR
jgi:hypothetical protein